LRLTDRFRSRDAGLPDVQLELVPVSPVTRRYGRISVSFRAGGSIGLPDGLVLVEVEGAASYFPEPAFASSYTFVAWAT